MFAPVAAVLGLAAAAEESDDALAASPEHSTGPGAAAVAAASTQVQLSLLRAELAASDAELAHVKAHLDILLQQRGTPAAAAAAAAVPAAAGRGQQMPKPEVDFLREVSLEALYSVQHAAWSGVTLRTGPRIANSWRSLLPDAQHPLLLMHHVSLPLLFGEQQSHPSTIPTQMQLWLSSGC
jgi:hypothetical protein